VVPYYVAMEAVTRSLHAVRGDLSDGQDRFRRALARIELDGPYGRIRLDENRQAITPNYVTRIRAGKGPIHRTVKVIEDVDQSFGGRFQVGGTTVSRTRPACTRGEPPPWAR
jgi:branched-chain amino acid transport system substrate-binding protein